MERSGLTFEHFFFGNSLKLPRKKSFFFADFAGLFQWGGYITTWGGYIEIWGGYIGMMRFLGYSWSTLLWHRCYYPHRSRDSVSPVCGIFSLYFRLIKLSFILPCKSECQPIVQNSFQNFKMKFLFLVQSFQKHIALVYFLRGIEAISF